MESKYKYNRFSLDEYTEYLETKRAIEVKSTGPNKVNAGDFLMIRPSTMNLHTFVAEENSCFFDICLPNYAPDSLRRITYYTANSEINPANRD